jgi:hypothetical protein
LIVNKRVAAACAATVALTMSMASIASPASAAAHKKPTHTKGHPAPKTFKLHGVVVSVHGNKAVVLTRNGVVNGKKVTNKLETVTITTKTKKHNKVKPAKKHLRAHAVPETGPALPVGADITATGTTAGTVLTVTEETTKPVAAEAIYGVVTSVTAGVVTLAGRDEAKGDGEHADHHDATFLDLNAATLSGAATNAAGVKAGQYIVALGENDDHVMAVANASVFDTAPDVLIGEVTAADAAAKTLTVASSDDRHDDADEEDTTAHDVTVDASKAQVVLNGNQQDEGASPTPATFPAVGDKVLIVSPASPTPSPSATATPTDSASAAPSSSPTPTPVQATLVFAFDAGDHGAVGDNNDNQGEDSQGDNGSSD